MIEQYDLESPNDTLHLMELDLSNMTDMANVTLNVTYYLSVILGPKHLPWDLVIPITVVYVIIFFCGVVGNVAVCIVIIRNPSMHTATNCYLFSLAVSDLTVLLLGLPNDLSVFYQQYPWVLGEIVCKLRALIAEMTSYASALTIVAFSLERYLAICHPLLAYTMAGISRAARIVGLIWLVAFISALPFAIYTGVTYMEFPPGSGQPILESAFCALLDEHRPKEWPLYEMASFIFFIQPMAILCLLYLRIGVRLRRKSLIRGRDDCDGVAHRGKDSRQASSRKQVLPMLVAVVIGFFICFAPFHAQRLLYVYGKHLPNYQDINEKMFYITGCFYYFSATINPILYNVMSVRYHEAFRDTFSACRRRRPNERSLTQASCISTVRSSFSGFRQSDADRSRFQSNNLAKFSEPVVKQEATAFLELERTVELTTIELTSIDSGKISSIKMEPIEQPEVTRGGTGEFTAGCKLSTLKPSQIVRQDEDRCETTKPVMYTSSQMDGVLDLTKKPTAVLSTHLTDHQVNQQTTGPSTLIDEAHAVVFSASQSK